MTYRLNAKQVKQLGDLRATEHVPWVTTRFFGPDGYTQTKAFHIAVGLRVTDDWSAIPPVSERVLRGNLLMEEVLETLQAMGLTMQLKINGQAYEMEEDDEWRIVHVEGYKYDPIETADGLADIKVIANGTAVSFGIPQTKVDNEVFASNMTKLDENGKPIVNRADPVKCLDKGTGFGPCEGDPTGESGMVCVNPNHLIDPTKPVGKVLKPATYVPANIARLYKDHVAPFTAIETE